MSHSTNSYGSPNASFRVPPEWQREMAVAFARADGKASPAVREFLSQSIAVFQAGRTELQRRFTLAEWCALADYFKNTVLEPSIWPYLHHEWREANEYSASEEDEPLFTKWSINSTTVGARLCALSPAAIWTFCDVLQRVKVDVTVETLREAGVSVLQHKENK